MFRRIPLSTFVNDNEEKRRKDVGNSREFIYGPRFSFFFRFVFKSRKIIHQDFHLILELGKKNQRDGKIDGKCISFLNYAINFENR